MTVLLTCVVIYIYTVIAFNFFRKFYRRVNPVSGMEVYNCESMARVSPLMVVCESMARVSPLMVVCESMARVSPLMVVCESMARVSPLMVVCESMARVSPLMVVFLVG